MRIVWFLEFLGYLFRPLTALIIPARSLTNLTSFELMLLTHVFLFAHNVAFQVRIKFHQSHGHTYFIWNECMCFSVTCNLCAAWHSFRPSCQGSFPFQTSMFNFCGSRSLLSFVFWCILSVKDYISLEDHFMFLNEMFSFHLNYWLNNWNCSFQLLMKQILVLTWWKGSLCFW